MVRELLKARIEKATIRKEIIDKYLAKRMTQIEAARQLNLSVRHVRRLIKSYAEQGVLGLISKRYDKPSNNKIADKVKRCAIELVKEHYDDFGPTLAHEKLIKHHCHLFSRTFSVETLRKWMIEAGIHRSRRSKPMKVHQSRPRCAHFGDLIQVDGSLHDWFEGRSEPCTLIAFIDDATSAVTEWQFCDAETTFAYMQGLNRHLDRYGRPLAIYSDRHSIFSNNAKRHREAQQPSQFARALGDLGIRLYTASSPQAKGRVERLFRTLQGRLIKEMRCHSIDSKEAANQFLETYRLEYNRRFAKKPQDSHDNHREVTLKPRELQLVLSKQIVRRLSKNLTCQHRTIQYLVKINGAGYGLRNTCIALHELPNGEIVLLHKGRELNYTTLRTHASQPSVQDAKTIRATVNKLSKTPAMKRDKVPQTHPWKRWNPGYLGSDPR